MTFCLITVYKPVHFVEINNQKTVLSNSGFLHTEARLLLVQRGRFISTLHWFLGFKKTSKISFYLVPPAMDRSSCVVVSLTSQQVFVCVCVNVSWVSLHVCQRVKPYQTSHHYKLIPQPQEGLHNGQCTVGVTQTSPSTLGSGLTVSNESTQQNLSIRLGPKKMYVLTVSGMTTPLLHWPGTETHICFSVFDPQQSLTQNILYSELCKI